MAHFTEDLISPMSLILDVHNPRFIAPVNPTQEDVRRHLLQHENVEDLIRSIIRFGGITPGERPIICEEDGSKVVLEGNRRVCAYQLLLDPSLYPSGWTRRLTAPPEIVETLVAIPVDVVASRNVADPVLAIRHVGGIKDWPTIAQYNFMVSRFESGKSIDDIRQDSGLRKRKSQIRDNISDFYLLRQALELTVWTPNELEGPLDWYAMDVTIFTRIFRTKDSLALVGLSFDPATLMPVWANEAIAEKMLELVARAAFVDKSIDTRTKSILGVPGIKDLLNSVSTPPPTEAASGTESEGSPDSSTATPPVTSGGTELPPTDSTPVTPPGGGPSGGGPSIPPTITPPPATPPIPSTIGFFEALTVEKLNPSNADHAGILNLARELRFLSKNNLLNNTPNAAAMVFRSLLELTLKYNLLNMGIPLSAVDSKKDPSLKSIINYYNQNLAKVIPDKGTQRVFKAVFKNEGIKESLDLIVHHTNSISATPDMLRMVAKAGGFTLIQDLLNAERL